MNYKMSYWLMRILGVGGILVMLIGGLTCKRDLPKRTLHKTCPYCKKPLD